MPSPRRGDGPLEGNLFLLISRRHQNDLYRLKDDMTELPYHLSKL